MSLRRTKIIATLGPCTEEADVLNQMINAGCNMVRLNFSHGTHQSHAKQIKMVRDVASSLHHNIGILADLQGPKVRIGGFKDQAITISPGQSFSLDHQIPRQEGHLTKVHVDYPLLHQDVSPGDILLMDDGKIKLKVTHIENTTVHTTVLTGGSLSQYKGLNKLGGGLTLDTITSKDKADIKAACELKVDYIALSFVKNAQDIQMLKDEIRQYQHHPKIIAKIERKEAVDEIESIAEIADGMMVAKGDLALEVGQEEVPGLQKSIIQISRDHNKAVITATQMMESMIYASIPTRAEVSDVANAVLDGTDSVMLCAETATGSHPALVISETSKICIGAESHPIAHTSKHRVQNHFKRIDEAIAMASMYIANHHDIKAIIALTETGATPLWMSRIRSNIPIFALSRHHHTLGLMTLYCGVTPIYFDPTNIDKKDITKEVVELLLKHKLIGNGDRVILTKGDAIGVIGGTNSLKIIEVGSNEYGDSRF